MAHSSAVPSVLGVEHTHRNIRHVQPPSLTVVDNDSDTSSMVGEKAEAYVDWLGIKSAISDQNDKGLERYRTSSVQRGTPTPL